MTAEQLRNSLLQEAISGRLVPQDPNDEPASVLLDKIRDEKARLIKEGKLKKGKTSAPITDDEKPFEIPASWEWVRLQNIVSILGDGIHGTPEYDISGKYYFINGNNLSQNQIVIRGNTSKVNEIEYNKYKKELNDKTVLVSINGTIGNVGHYKGEPVILGKSACYFNLMDVALKPYITMLMYTDYFLTYAKGNATGSTIKNVSLAVMNNFVLPLPPLAEQKRIVAKLEELLPIVEQYGKAQTELDELNATLPSRLRQSILQEAIQGKLVPQDPTEGTAEELLKLIGAEKQQLIKEGKLKKGKTSAPITDDEKPFEIPASWEWVRISSLCTLITKGTTPRGGNVAYMDKGIGFLRAENISGIDKIDTSNLKYIDEKTNEGYLKRSILQENDLLITIAGTLGRTAIVKKEDLPLNANQAVCLCRWVNVISIDLLYIAYALNSPAIQNIMLACKKITAIPNLTLEIIANTIVPIPPLAEQKRIVAKIEELFAEIDKLK